MSINQASAEGIGRAVAGAIHAHWVMFLIEGIILVILGIIAIVLPPIATIAFTIIIGWIFLVSGIVGLITTFMARQAPGFWWALISAAVAVLAGGILLANPAAGVATLTYVLIAFFLVDGVIIIVMAFEHRRELSGRTPSR